MRRSEKINYHIICERGGDSGLGRWARTPRKGVEKVLLAVRRDRGVGGWATINRNLPEVEGVRHERSRLGKKKICPQDDLSKQW